MQAVISGIEQQLEVWGQDLHAAGARLRPCRIPSDNRSLY
jgi:hypothetical protein